LWRIIMAKNYYSILGVSSSASPDEVRSAYRRLSKEFHPDHYSGGSKIFQEIHQAYLVLGNPERRRQYEQGVTKIPIRVPARPQSYREPEPLIPEDGPHAEKPIDMGKISPVRSFHSFTPSMDEIFDWFWDNYTSLNQPKSGRIEQLTLEVPLTAEQALRGGNARVMVPARAVCPTCRGYGGVGPYECTRCAGEGAISGEVPIYIAFPPGLVKDHAVMIPLDRFGIRNLKLTVLFRPTDVDRI
jgi:DnaJ-class molecular chaperone